MTREIVEAAPAKVNLSLLVTGRRADGYHLLDSLVVFGPAADRIVARPSDTLSLAVHGPFAGGLDGEDDNLVLRAARALAEWAGRPATGSLELEKNLPVAAGIGGGSADAAATLRALARLWNVKPQPSELAAIGLRLGADIPACIASTPTLMTGIGEHLARVPTLPRCGLLLVNPRVGVATAEVFRARTGGYSASQPLPENWQDSAELAATLAMLGNDLESPAIRVAPVIATVLDALRRVQGCLLARMSGSGATCFGLFASPEEAETAREALSAAWWSCAGPLYERPAAAVLTG